MKYSTLLATYNRAAAQGNHATAIQFARLCRERENQSANVSRDHWNDLIAQHKNALRLEQFAGSAQIGGSSPSTRELG